jgi:hypothetical protein
MTELADHEVSTSTAINAYRVLIQVLGLTEEQAAKEIRRRYPVAWSRLTQLPVLEEDWLEAWRQRYLGC